MVSARRPGLFFVSDGMRQDLLERYADEGVMPAMAAMLREGARGENGVLPPMPTNTGAGWATLATGAWSGRTGAINNALHLPGDPVNIGRSGFGAELVEVETLVQAAERQGLKALTFEWASAMPAQCQGPVVSYFQYYAARGIVSTFAPEEARHDGAGGRGLFCHIVKPAPAEGWANLPPSALPPMAVSFLLPTQDAAANPDRTLHILLIATSASGYDQALVTETLDAAQPLARLRVGEWQSARLSLTDGRLASFWLKCLDLSPDLRRVRLYLTTLARTNAHPAALEERIATWDLPALTAADYGPFQARLVDEQTYIEQGLLWFQVARPMLARLVEEERPDLLLVGAPVTDEFSHQFMALTTPAYPGYTPERAAVAESHLRTAYQQTDAFLAHARALMPAETVTLVSSDHGFGAAWRSVNANLVLNRAGLLDYDRMGRPAPSSRAVAYCAGATGNVYLSVQGRDPGGVVQEAEIPGYQARIIAAFQALQDAAAPESPVLARAVRKQEADAVETGAGPANMRHARTGDVLLFLHPPFQFDGANPKELISEAPMLGQHGYLADTVDPARGVNVRSAFLLAGPGIQAGVCLPDARAIDLAPTLAAAMGIDGPKEADGEPLVGAFEEK